MSQFSMKMNRLKVLNYVFKVMNCSASGQSANLQFLSSANCLNATTRRLCSLVAVPPENSEKKHSVLDPVDKIDLTDYGSEVPLKFNFAMYADKSPLIQKFIDLGVNLYEIQKDPEKAKFLLTLNFEKIKLYLNFLCDSGVSSDGIGRVITKNPLIFKEDLDDLQVRVNYLKSKKFDTGMISHIITRCPKFISTPVRVIDERLGFLQQTFNLKGDDVRLIITREPKLALIMKKYLIENIFALKEEMGLDKYILKKVVVSEPKLLRQDTYDLVSTFEYLTKYMNVPLSLIINQPKVLTCRKFILKERHNFLKALGRAQYCNFVPGYINLMDLITTNDNEFCEKVAKVPVKLYYDFLKTL